MTDNEDTITIIPEYKTIRDNVHGLISLSNLIVMIIDTKEFQRLRNLKQLGMSYLVYPNATHSRFEHSIGTSHLAGKLMECIMKTTPPDVIEDYLADIQELKSYYERKYENKVHIIDNYIIELVKIAALCHDLGHGPFSHVFDDFFLPYTENKDHRYSSHEVRSCVLLEKIIKEHKELSKIILDDDIKFMQNLIDPSERHTGFLYQIVSNNLNGLDVDKYDYITRDSRSTGVGNNFNYQRLIEHVRVINHTICYPEQAIGDIMNLFTSRYHFHKVIYGHKSVVASQQILTEIFHNIDPIIKLSNSIDDMDNFIRMTDEYIMTCPNILNSQLCKIPRNLKGNLNTCEKLIEKLNRHELYPFVDSCVSKNKINLSQDDFRNVKCDTSKIVIFTNKIGLVSGSKTNPFDNIYTFKTKDSTDYNNLTIKKKNIYEYSLLRTDNYQEYVTMIYYKEKDKEIIDELKTEFQNKIKSIIIN